MTLTGVKKQEGAPHDHKGDHISAPQSHRARTRHAFAPFIKALYGPRDRKSGQRRVIGTGGGLLFNLLLGFITLCLLAILAVFQDWLPFDNKTRAIIWLLNSALVGMLFLVALGARRMTSLWFSQRKTRAGSRLYLRLVVLFGVLAALPAIILAIFSAFFFHFGLQSWFNDTVRTAVYDSQAVAEAYLEEHQQLIRADTLAMANDIERQAALMMDEEAAYNRVLDTQSYLRNLSEALIFGEEGRIIAQSGLTFSLTLEKVPDYLLDRARGGEVVVLTDPDSDRVRALLRLNTGEDHFLFVGRSVDPEVLNYLESTKDSASRYQNLERSFTGIQVTATLIFIVSAVLLMLAAIWAGIVLARQLARPIGSLVNASERVRAGNLDISVPVRGDIEDMDYLSESFNKMTAQLRAQREELIATNRLLDARRRLSEAILTGVPAAVIGIDPNGKVTFANQAANGLFENHNNDHDKRPLEGQILHAILPDFEEAMDSAFALDNRLYQDTISYKSADHQDGAKTQNLRIAVERENGIVVGAVATFDDITALQSAQRKAAWADVARRIAHEIKNPLTPIQLSAERLKRKYLPLIETDPEIFETCTDTIIRHVGTIGDMVNEFSEFARLPEAKKQYVALHDVLADITLLEKEAHASIDILFETKGDLRPVHCDPSQIGRAYLNVLQNAIESVEERMKQNKKKGKVKATLNFDVEGGVAIIVYDNGIGLPKNVDAARLSEPYATYKKGGTGLGLAIVQKIMADHGGRFEIEACGAAGYKTCSTLFIAGDKGTF